MVLTEAMQDYLRTIYALGGHEVPVNTMALADALGKRPASITGMIKRLAELNLVTHEPYRGVVLTLAGAKVALEVLRHHRLIELYLAEALGFSWDEVHKEADRLEHHISEELEARIFAALGHPTIDPHGDPIPSYDGDLPPEAGEPMTALAGGDQAVVRRVLNQDGALLRYLAHLGLVPQAQVEVVQVAPADGPLTVRVNGDEHALAADLARQIVVDRVE
ncbi:MAG TPA: metal-dependent transcriptional regulator [Ardenticatenaceae bacterium]|nr:metal-dependent transcriptional regulator [Ardenticatenaceae bacterium]